jgi:hypothetical protein
MTTLQSFSSPANQAIKDFGDDQKGLQAFLKTWSTNLNSWTEIAIVGNPWSSRNDYNRYYYYNPLTTDVPDGSQVTPIQWNAFPNRLFNFFQDVNAPKIYQLQDEQIFALADTGYWLDNFAHLGNVQVPTNPELCPTTNWNGDKQDYTPQGPRGWLDEYCEWSVKRDANGKLRQVMFTCENPSYWFNLWRHSPSLVTKLYQTHINPAVQEADLYLRDDNGNPVFDPLLGYHAYDPTNKWNRGTQTQSDYGGAMHLSSPPNTLAAEIYLAAAGTIPRTVGNNDPQTLICCTWYGRPRRNSDPHIGQVANQVANRGFAQGTTPPGGQMLSLTDPIGLYIQSPAFTNWQVPNKQKPGGGAYDLSSFWQVTRGYVDPHNPGQGSDSILHAVFTVPDELQPADIMITDPSTNRSLPLQWAGQLARTFQIALRVTTIAPTDATRKSYPVPQEVKCCVPIAVPASDPALQPWPVQFLSSVAYQANSVDDSPAYVKQATTTEMALVVQGGTEKAVIKFAPPDGIQPVTIKQFIGGNLNAPGQTAGGSTQVYIFDLVVAENAPLGERQITITNQDKKVLPEQKVGEPGWLIITSSQC